MDDNTTIVLAVLILAIMFTTIAVLVFYEDYTETELETCMEECNNALYESEEPECILQCIKYLSNHCLRIQVEG